MKTDIKREMRRLITLRADNVLEVFNRQLNIYKVTHSDSVIVDGETLNGMQRGMFLLLGRNDKDGINTAKNIEISDVDKNGIPLTLERFINNQLERYETLLLETTWSDQYDAEKQKLKLYIDFLKSYKVDKNKDDKKQTTLEDFFPSLQPQQIENLQKEFSQCRGIEMACFIHLCVKDGLLEFVKNSPKKSLSNFCRVFAGMETKDYEAVRKLFKYDTYFLDNENHLDNYKTKDKIKDAFKVG